MNGGFVATNEHLAALAACFGCSNAAASQLLSYAQSRQFANRTAIAHQGDESSWLYLILEGAVTLEIFGTEGQQAQLARHGPGEIFGAFPHSAYHRSTVNAIGATRLLALPTAQLFHLVNSNAEIAAGMTTLLARQLDLVLDRMAARIGLTATGRFYRALLLMADEEGMICPAPVIAALALTVNTSRETASRALATLLRRGIVDRLPDGLRVVSRRLLEELVI
jgi:CRP/FNR family transcriptional regulator, cyclic AMP receptor protein